MLSFFLKNFNRFFLITKKRELQLPFSNIVTHNLKINDLKYYRRT